MNDSPKTAARIETEFGQVSFACETYAQVIDDLLPLLKPHHRELGPYQDKMPTDPDFDFYKKASEAGLCQFYTARLGGELIGYAAYLIRPSLHYRTTMWALCDMVWLSPGRRGHGIGHLLFDFIERDLRNEKKVFVMHTTAKKDHPALSGLLTQRGHNLVELGYQKRLD